MEPRIQYAKTSDGVSIAFSVSGSGPALIHMPNIPWSHIQWGWLHMPEQRAVAEASSSQLTYVQYDCRGSGSSTRDIEDLSLEDHLSDLTAVVDRVGFERFALLARSNSVPVAVTYAVRHPERLSHLVLHNGYARCSDLLATPQGQTFHLLRDKDWTIHTEMGAQLLMGWSRDGARRGASFLREATSQEGALAAFREIDTFDVTDLLPRIRVPTLVAHGGGPGFNFPPADLSRDLAAQIPGAEFVAGETLAAVIVAVGEFLGLETDPSLLATPSAPPDTSVILFADIASSTALTERLGDAAFRERASALDTALRGAITGEGGTPIDGKLLGDGVLATFSSARQAIDAARRCRDASAESGLALHLGIHAGDVIREANNVFGGAVNLAARIADASEPGEILVSDTLRGLARTSAGVAFEDRGERDLKGIAEPVRLFAVQERE